MWLVRSVQRIGARTGGFGNKRTSGDHPKYCIVQISKNTEKSPGKLRFTATQTLVSNHQLTLVWKTLKGMSKVGDLCRGWPKGSLFDSYYTKVYGRGATPFPGLLHFTSDPYLIMPSVKQGGIKHHFLSLWDWTEGSRAIGEHSNHHDNNQHYGKCELYGNEDETDEANAPNWQKRNTRVGMTGWER